MQCKECSLFEYKASWYGRCKIRMAGPPTLADSECPLFPDVDEGKCEGCARHIDHFACCLSSVEENQQGCENYIDKYEKEFRKALVYWQKHGLYSREKILGILDEFERVFETRSKGSASGKEEADTEKKIVVITDLFNKHQGGDGK